MRIRISLCAISFCLFLLPFSMTAQEKKAQGASAPARGRAEQKSPKDDQLDVNSLLDEARDDARSNPQSSLEKVKNALAQSISDNNKQGEADCYVLLGNINMDIQEWKLANENYSTALNIIQIHFPRSSDLAGIYRGMGNSNVKLGLYEQALANYNDAMNAPGSKALTRDIQMDISEVYYQQGEYAKALEIIEKIESDKSSVRKLSTSSASDPALQVRIENQKAKIFAQTNDLEKASQSFDNSQRIILSNPAAASTKSEEELQTAKEGLAYSLSEQERYDEAIDLRNRSIEFNIESKNYGEVSRDKVALGKSLEAKGETQAAIQALEEAAFIADTIGDPKKQSEAFLSLADLYDKSGNTKQALNSYKLFSNTIRQSEVQKETKLLEKSDLIRQQRDIEGVARWITAAKQEEEIARAMVSKQRVIIYGLILLLGVIGITSYFIYKNAQASKRANQLLALKSLRSQMNPHFIFNALNSLNHFVAQNDERTANKFLSEFSRLMRLVLENSQQDFIPLSKEEEIISLYLKLEHYRFRDKFDYAIDIDEKINRELVSIPPMLIQPYIENAVWHGLRYKDSRGFLSLKMSQQGDEVVVVIEDNGIGRKKSEELKTENQKKHHSTGIKNIRERLGIINRIYDADYKVAIEDLAAGTRVRLQFPAHSKHLTYA
jgi:tetratricopeptide (TPR) repeat protein